MTAGRMATFIIGGLMASASGIVALISLVLALFGIVAWLWPIISAVVFLAAVVVTVGAFIRIVTHLDESFEPNGILGKALKNMENMF